MRLNQFRILVALKKYGSFSKAAQQLYISQPSLSAAVKELEEELGFEIIERSKKGVTFTRKGDIVLKYSKDIMDSVDAIECLGKTDEDILQGHLDVGSVSYICHLIVLDSILQLKELYPKTSTSLHEESSYDIVKLVANQELDIGIIMMSNLEELYFQQQFDKHGIEYQELFRDQMHFMVGRKNPLFNKDKATMQELLQFQFAHYRNALNRFNEDVLLHYNNNMEFIKIDNRASLVKYIVNSETVCAVPTCTLWNSTYLQDDKLKLIEIEDFDWYGIFAVIYLKDDVFSVEKREFINLLKNQILFHMQ